MTSVEATARLAECANGAISGNEVRAMARDLYGKDTDREVSRLIREAGYTRFAGAHGGNAALDPAYIALLRREYAGPAGLDGVNLAEGPDVVTVEDGADRWYITPRGAVMRLNHWLAERLAPKSEPETT